MSISVLGWITKKTVKAQSLATEFCSFSLILLPWWEWACYAQPHHWVLTCDISPRRGGQQTSWLGSHSPTLPSLCSRSLSSLGRCLCMLQITMQRAPLLFVSSAAYISFIPVPGKRSALISLLQQELPESHSHFSAFFSIPVWKERNHPHNRLRTCIRFMRSGAPRTAEYTEATSDTESLWTHKSWDRKSYWGRVSNLARFIFHVLLWALICGHCWSQEYWGKWIFELDHWTYFCVRLHSASLW